MNTFFLSSLVFSVVNRAETIGFANKFLKTQKNVFTLNLSDICAFPIASAPTRNKVIHIESQLFFLADVLVRHLYEKPKREPTVYRNCIIESSSNVNEFNLNGTDQKRVQL